MSTTDTAAPPCLTCKGEGVQSIPVCYGGSDHAGHHCGGTVCGSEDEECSACAGTGVESCADCGEPSALVLFGDAICAALENGTPLDFAELGEVGFHLRVR